MTLNVVKKNADDDKRFAFFGYDRFSAAKNMAIDEVLKEKAEKGHTNFIRFFDFLNPAIILSISDSPKCIKGGAYSESVDISRRRSGGKPIYIDDNAIAYTVTGVYLEGDEELKYADRVHNYFGKRIIKSIEELTRVDASRISIGEHFAIKVDGKPIAGHAQNIKPEYSFFYHGVLAVADWDSASIDKFLRIPEKDLNELHGLPSLLGITPAKMSLQEAKKGIVEHMLTNMTDGNYYKMSKDETNKILAEADRLVKVRYGTKEWILRSETTNLNEESRFCLLYRD